MRVVTILLLAVVAALAGSIQGVDAEGPGRSLQATKPKPKPPSPRPPRPRPPRPRPPRPRPPSPKPPRPRPPKPRPPRPRPPSPKPPRPRPPSPKPPRPRPRPPSPRPRPPPPLPGTTFGNAINLGSPASITKTMSSKGYPDTRLSGCADPDYYDGKNFGDGADVIFKYTVPFTGYVLVQACSDAFQATLTLIGNGEDADGLPIVNGSLACGYFDNCSNNPDLFDPTGQTILPVRKSQVIYIHVTGQEATDAGAFKLAVSMLKPGGDPAASIDLGSSPGVLKAGTTVGLPDSYTGNCTDGKDGPDAWYSYSANVTGLMRVKVCSTSLTFTPSVVLRTDSTIAAGLGEIQLPGCGSCDFPITVSVKSGDFFYFVVSGSGPAEAGAFTLSVTNTPLPPTGLNFGNAINLGSGAVVKRNLSSSAFPDTALSGCADPDYYDGNNFGDGGDVYHKYTVPFDGFVNVQACSDVFQATLTIIGNGEDADGLPIVNGSLACGYFDNCGADNPDLTDPTGQTILPVTKGQVIYILVTGQGSTDFGPYKLAVSMIKPGGDSVASIDLGSDPIVTKTGTTVGLPDSYTGNCTDGKDGPDVWYSYSANVTGLMRVKVCSTSLTFTPSVVLRTDSTIAAGLGEIQLPGCGSCDTPVIVSVKSGDFFYFVVSGSGPTESGPYTLSIDNVVPATVGTNFGNAIDLGSALVIQRNDTSYASPDSLLSGCADPDYYNGNTFGDGGDVVYKYTAPVDGFVNVQACSDVFQATLTIIGDGEDADGLPIVNGSLACGYFDNCSNNPDLFDPDGQTILPVTQGQVIYILVTGQSGADFGPFKLAVKMFPPGSDMAAAIFLGNDTAITQPGNSSGLPDSYTNNCTAGADGPDVWYTYAPPGNGTLAVSACSAAFTPTVSLQTDSATAGGGIVPVAGCGLCGTPLTINVLADSFYYLVVSGSGPAQSGAFSLTVNFTPSA